MRARALALCALLAGPAAAHPHVFIDGGVDFVLDDQARVTALRVTWIYDAFTSLYVLQSLNFDQDADGALSETERAFLIEDQTAWDPGFQGDSYLYRDAAKLALGAPQDGDVTLVDGRLRVTFTRPLTAPEPGDGLVAKLYDPTYYYAYSVTEPPQVLGSGCQATLVPFVANSMLGALQSTLSELTADETPEQADVGALFADQVRLSCG